MILEEETFREFGYSPCELKPHSRKKILAACDGCGKIRELHRQDYRALCHPCTMRGGHHTEEARKKMSKSQKGNKNALGSHPSEETKKKISDALKGKKVSEETRRKLSEAGKRRHHTEETKTKMSEARKGNKNSLGKKLGENNPKWNGGYDAARARREKIQRSFGFIPLNDRFLGCEAHHIDKEFVLHIPKEMHRSIYHSVTRDINMEEINALAIDFVYGG